MEAKYFSYFCDIGGDLKKPLIVFDVKYLTAENNALQQCAT